MFLFEYIPLQSKNQINNDVDKSRSEKLLQINFHQNIFPFLRNNSCILQYNKAKSTYNRKSNSYSSINTLSPQQTHNNIRVKSTTFQSNLLLFGENADIPHVYNILASASKSFCCQFFFFYLKMFVEP